MECATFGVQGRTLLLLEGYTEGALHSKSIALGWACPTPINPNRNFIFNNVFKYVLKL